MLRDVEQGRTAHLFVNGNGSSLQFIQALTLQVKMYNVNRGSVLTAFKKGGGQTTSVVCAVGFRSTRNVTASLSGEERNFWQRSKPERNKLNWPCHASPQ